MKTRCIGRFLIDMPAEAQIELVGARIDGFNIAAFSEGPDEFRTRIAAREAHVVGKPSTINRLSNLESATQAGSDSMRGKVFVHSRTVFETTAAAGLTLTRRRYESVDVEALVHGNGVSMDLSAQDRDPAFIKDGPTLVEQAVANPNNAMPAEPGFCLDRAYIRHPLSASQGEEIMMHARLPSNPDFPVMLILAAGLKHDKQGLLERGAAADGRLSPGERMRITKLRALLRKIGGLRGEELVERFDEENGAQVHAFQWEVNGTENDVNIPHVLFKMNTGKAKNSAIPSVLTEAVALALWDRMTSSIRLRSTSRVLPPAKKPLPGD